MMSLFWILFVFFQSLQIQVYSEYKHLERHQWQPRDDEHDNSQYEFGCHSTMCTTCTKKSFISSILSCEDSDIHDEICSYETLPQTWESGCSMINFFDVLPYRQYNHTLESTYWYPARRNVDYGPYEFTMWGSWYGKSVARKINISTTDVENIFLKHCLIEDARTKVITPEHCSARHKHNCSITKIERSEFCSSSCVYCSEDYDCVTTQSVCSEKKFSYASSYPAAEKACSLCLKSVNSCQNIVSMVLSFGKELCLTVYNPECLFKNGDPDYLFCFTDASEQLKKRVSLNILYNHTTWSYSNQNKFIVYRVALEEYMGQYWCEARASKESLFEYKSNTVVAYKTAKGNEFAVRLKINDICNYTDCDSINELDFLIDDVKDPIERNKFGKVRVMRVNEFHNGSFADIIIHVSTLHRKPGIISDFYKLQGLLQSYPDYIEVIYCKSSEHCLPETSQNLTWPIARQFQTVLPSELCVQANGLPVTRFCEGDFLFGLNWREVNGKCSSDHDFGEDTILLQSFLNQSVSKDVIENVSEIVHNGNLTLVDLYFVSQILDKSTELAVNSTFLNASLNVVNGLLEKDVKLLFEAQETLNITDSYLRASEIIATNLTASPSDLLTVRKDKVIFHSFNPIIQNASGFVMYKNYSIKQIPLLGDFDDIEDVENVKLALYVASDDIQTIITNNLTNVSMVAVIYLNDRLFPSNTSSTADLVVNLNLPNYEGYLQSPVPLLVSSEQNANFNCVFWDYGDLHQRKKGNWSSLGSNYDGNFKNISNLQVCSYSHLTHLALLVLAKQNDTYLEGTNDDILSLITAIGSLLSLFGIFCIFLTSFLFRSWRDKTGTQILLHLSVATLFEIVFMYMNGIRLFDCVLAGSILQYVVISKFSWMLVYAFCQYLRFVRVFGPMPNHLVLKSIIFGWGFGLIPTAAVLISNSSTYREEKFCYPNGNYLYLGVYLPVAIILIINFCVFCKIMCEITSSKMEKYHSANLKVQHIKLAILLFSVLGIPWVFGLISNVMPYEWLKLIFVYIFTTTSIIQGFLMGLFYVIFNEETRDCWRRFLFGKKRTYEMFSSKKSNSASSVS